MDWLEQLECNQCSQALNIPFGFSGQYVCPSCKKQFKIIVNEISYAVADSNSCEYFRYGNNDEIEVRCFCNYPIDLLEEAWQDYQEINDDETNPVPLLPIVKKYHDAIKGHGRRFLDIHPGNLSAKDRSFIKKDDDRKRSLNIKNLFDFLKKAYPSDTKITSFFTDNESLITRLWWTRNKQEHILYTEWPINAKVFEDLGKNPDDPSVAPDNLNADFIKRINNLAVDAYELILNIRPRTEDPIKYSEFEQFRLQ